MNKEFSIQGYRSIIETALSSGYAFISFDKTQNGQEKFCLLRHDIDADLEAAKTIAAVEHEYSVIATYFVMLRSPVYNLFGRHNHRCLEEILKMGHSLALHYDEAFYPDNKKSLQELVESEAYILEKAYGNKINAVSFHQPGPKILANEIKIENFINTYDKKDLEGIFYISDSNMNWKNNDIWDLLRNSTHNKIQLLTHPMWWVGSGQENTHKLWDKALLDNFNRSLDQVIGTEGAFGTPRKIKKLDLL